MRLLSNLELIEVAEMHWESLNEEFRILVAFSAINFIAAPVLRIGPNQILKLEKNTKREMRTVIEPAKP
jgi:hypothetical protein